MSDVNIKISGIDHLVEAAKLLLQRVIIPPFEEVGLLFSDQVKYFRFRNQVAIIAKAEEYLREKNIKTRKASLKTLAPLLEQCSLEEDDALKDKWTALLINTVKEDSSIDNSIYSYILGQLSHKDAKILDHIFQISVKEPPPPGATFQGSKLIVTGSHLQSIFSSINLSIDNLIRLGLLKNQAISDSDVLITDLGISFIISCTLP